MRRGAKRSRSCSCSRSSQRLGGFLFGYDTGVISGALLFIKPAFHASALQQQAIIGSLLIGAVVGATASGYLAEAMSRKWTKVLSGCIYVAAALWSAFASGATELIAARFVLGLSVGTASFVAPMYIAEVAPRRIRGGLVSFNQLMIVIGNPDRLHRRLRCSRGSPTTGAGCSAWARFPAWRWRSG